MMPFFLFYSFFAILHALCIMKLREAVVLDVTLHALLWPFFYAWSLVDFITGK